MGTERKVSAAQRRQMIAEAAYFRAEKRGFAGGDTEGDWREAEREVDARLSELEEQHLLGRAEEALGAARQRLAGAKRKVASLSAEARAEWSREHDRLTELRDALQMRAEELRDRGAEALETVRARVEKLRQEMAEILHGAAKPPH